MGRKCNDRGQLGGSGDDGEVTRKRYQKTVEPQGKGAERQWNHNKEKEVAGSGASWFARGGGVAKREQHRQRHAAARGLGGG